ncbi:UNVERIFIED_CONTAM: hypothetical protein FKN15_054938 [Acipenser sinensis]
MKKQKKTPQPHDREGIPRLELSNPGLCPDEEPLLHSIQMERVKGRYVTELGAHKAGRRSCSSPREVEAVAVPEEIRAAVQTTRTEQVQSSRERTDADTTKAF